MTPDLHASIRGRLLNVARARKEEFVRTLARYAAERWLYRLGASPARERCLLKGASLLEVWLADPYRRTKDVDLLASGASDHAAVALLVAEVCAVVCVEDGLAFDTASLIIDDIRAEDEYVGKRARFRAYLGKTWIPVQVDVGFGDALAVAPESVSFPVLLSNLPSPTLRAYPREQSIAEKFEAMVTLGRLNSRMKDFHDVWALAGAFEFDGPTLQRAMEATFARRGTPWTAEPPDVLRPAFYADPELQSRWRHYLASESIVVPPPDRFEQVGERLIAFLMPRWREFGAMPARATWMQRTGWTTS